MFRMLIAGNLRTLGSCLNGSRLGLDAGAKSAQSARLVHFQVQYLT